MDAFLILIVVVYLVRKLFLYKGKKNAEKQEPKAAVSTLIPLQEDNIIMGTPPRLQQEDPVEKGPLASRRLRLLVSRALIRTGLRYYADASGNILWINLSSNGDLPNEQDLFIAIYHEGKMLSYTLNIIGGLKDEDLVPITELCNRLNENISYGRFLVDYTEGMVKAVIYYHLLTDEFAETRHNRYLAALLQYKVKYADCFKKVVNDHELPILATMSR